MTLFLLFLHLVVDRPNKCAYNNYMDRQQSNHPTLKGSEHFKEKTMRTVIAHSIKSVREVKTRFGLKAIAEIEIQGEPKKELWMSIKQGDKLTKCFDTLNEHGGYSTKRAECHIILDDGEKGERFVWCGIHTPKFSEIKFLEDKFGVKCESPYVGRYDLEAETPAEPNESLKDE